MNSVKNYNGGILVEIINTKHFTNMHGLQFFFFLMLNEDVEDQTPETYTPHKYGDACQ